MGRIGWNAIRNFLRWKKYTQFNGTFHLGRQGNVIFVYAFDGDTTIKTVVTKTFTVIAGTESLLGYTGIAEVYAESDTTRKVKIKLRK